MNSFIFNLLNANSMLLSILWRLLLFSLFVAALTLILKKYRWLKLYGLVLLIVLGGLYFASRQPETPCPSTISTAAAADLNGSEIAAKLFDQQLEWQQAKRPLASGKITAYKIEKVTPVESMPGVYSVVYSIKSGDDTYKAGNGYIADGGWILHKSLYVRVVQNEDGFKLEVVGTGL